jgi:hypothetical protein
MPKSWESFTTTVITKNEDEHHTQKEIKIF